MKSFTLLLLAGFCLIAVNAQKINLNEGDEFTYRTSLYEYRQKLAEDGTINRTTESIYLTQTFFKVTEVHNGKYRLTAHHKNINRYNRQKGKNDEQWQTIVFYNEEIDDSIAIIPKHKYQIDFFLSNEGDLVEAKVIPLLSEGKSSNENNLDSLILKSFELRVSEIFRPFMVNRKKSEKITINKDEFIIQDIVDSQIILNSTKENKSQIEKRYDLRTGMLLEENETYNNLEGKEIGNIDRGMLLKRTNIIIENKQPCSFTFRINENEIDTTFLETNVTIRGKIIHPNQNREVSIEWYEMYPNDYSKKYSVVTELDKDNVFEIRLNIDHFKKVTFRHGEEVNFYVTPGDNLFITADMDAFDETITATGVGSRNLNYSFKKYLFEETEKLNQRGVDIQAKEKYVELTPSEFKKHFSVVLDEKQKYLNINSKWIDPQQYLAEFWRNQITIVDLLRYYPTAQKDYRILAKKEPYKIDRKVFFDSDFYTLIHPDNAMMAYSDNYGYFLKAYVFFLLEDKMKEITGKGKTFFDGYDNYFARLYNSRYEFSDYFFSGYNQYILKYQTVCDALRQSNWNSFVELYNLFIKEYPGTYKAEILTEAYEKAKNVAPGQPAFDFKLLDFKGNKVRLSDFRGKVVYINFWSTASGPSRSSIHWHGKKMQEAFEDKDIVLMYIALEDDIEKPKQFMKEEKIEGLQLIAKGCEKEMLREKYFFSVIPHHYIIDKEGKIVQRKAPDLYQILKNKSILVDVLEPK